MTDWSVQEEIAQIAVKRPHVVLLGAGASRAAFPSGDRNGRRLPLMLDFVEVVAVQQTLEACGIEWRGRNFEDVYTDLVQDANKASVRHAVDDAVFSYFSSLALPDQPTLYDILILSLRPKDVIATFNWDPFLIQAAGRNRHLSDVPKLLFLHGNALQGYCERDKMHGRIDAVCSRCGRRLERVKLLYPVREKNYENEPAIESAWSAMKWALQHAFMVTVFGYSAPQTDRSAVELLRGTWGGWQNRVLEQFEFIDIRDEAALIESWKGFIDPGQRHYEVHDNFYDSWIAKHPRRTGEAWWNQYLEVMFLEDNPVPHVETLDEIWKWYHPLIVAESSEPPE